MLNRTADSVDRRSVRSARLEDLNALLEIASDSVGAAEWSKKSYEQLLDDKEVVSLVFEHQGRVSGFLIARYAVGQAEILNLAVSRESRRKGQAGTLLSAALDEFRRHHVNRVFLEVRESNRSAISFYVRKGFLTIGRRKAYYRNPVEDAWCMEKKIADSL